MRIRLGTAAMLAAIFASGVAVGFALDRGVPPASSEGVEPERRFLRIPAGSGQPERAGPRPSPNGVIIDRMDLTEEQRAQVDSVVAHYGAHMRQLQRDFRPRFQAVVDSTRQALREVLDEDQRARYDSLQAEIERRRPGASRSDRP